MSTEFPAFPDKFKEFSVDPIHIENKKKKPFDVTLKVRNSSEFGVLFKVKCTSNSRIKLVNCADILGPLEETEVGITRLDVEPEAGDQLCVIYALVGECWIPKEKRNAYQAWLRATSQQVTTRSIFVEVSNASD
ncbi:unnamed protein product [Bursaphelenchus xylophilus]|uniref:Major sperm protein n=1 Tax=Bursaphelenchus xylophilus TaxID=6326 RepID=A0A1I7S5T0_BURXY|nr:unnamed protein product [Bursaphelenchus xylophilus]CAG9125032.1 unnamed protein product [Bursaphelenchus xylophilus]